MERQIAEFTAWSAREHDADHHAAAVEAFRAGIGA